MTTSVWQRGIGISLRLGAAFLLAGVSAQLPAQGSRPSALEGVQVQPDQPSGEHEAAAPDEDFSSQKGLYALFYTTEGSFACRLFEDEAYQNVRNFIDLACGYRVWKDPRNGEERREPYYDALPIYNVVRNAMIVGGDPLANGTGNPGYFLDDEIRDDLNFDVPGRLAMANLGGRPNTNSGIWFVTGAPLPALNGHYTIIGQVVYGMDVVRRISRADADATGRPTHPIMVNRVDIVRVLDNGQVVSYERSTSRPYAEVDSIPLAQRSADLPIWMRERGETTHRFRLPELPSIYDSATSPERAAAP
jgi:peptidyl-prolyl cis-trans isomerase A (cyclophilin A)